jgi:polar amino acid transport system substrate-binding protein
MLTVINWRGTDPMTVAGGRGWIGRWRRECGVAVLAALLAAPAAAATLRVVGSDVATTPYMMGDGPRYDPERPGIAIEMLRRIGDELRLDLAFERVPNKRVLQSLIDGGADAALIFSYSAERAAQVAYPMRDGRPDRLRRIATLTYLAYRRTGDSVRFNDDVFVDLEGMVGGNMGYSVIADMKAKGYPIYEIESPRTLVDMLLARRVGVILGQDVVLAPFLAGRQKQIEPAGVVSSKDYFIPLSQRFVARDPALAAAIWDRVGELRDEMTAALAPRYVGN